jgi:hypothetical protein
MIKLFNKVIRLLLGLSRGYSYFSCQNLVYNISGFSVNYNRTWFSLVAVI